VKTVVLSGKKAAGRVALVDDEDYELVSRYRWYVWEVSKAGHRPSGPYAIANVGHGRRNRRVARMHNLIMGRPGIDHEDHDGLNNQRSNLRPATNNQNGANQRPQEGRSSEHKGVSWDRRRSRWQATIKVHGKSRGIGAYATELEAAYAYDAAARELFGEFACPNFPEGPTRAMCDEWQTAREAHDARMAEVAVERERTRKAAQKQWWDRREPETRICAECGEKYQSKSARSSFCGKACGWLNWSRRRAEREGEGRLF
jgi:hypothetical protein